MQALEVILQDMKNVVLEAAEMLGNRENAANITVKGVSDYVTRVDLQVQQFISEKLGEKYPEIQFVGEEKDNSEVDLEKWAWVLDPVDGTTNLIHDYHRSSISLALFEKREPVIGLVYQPYTKELYWAIKGKGAFLNGEQLHVSKVEKMEDSLISIGTAPYHKKEYGKQTFEKIYRVFMDCQDIRRIGSAAIDLAEVAAGRIDAFFEEELKLWDYGAGKLLVEEAGGVVTRMDGEPLNAAYISDVLGGNPAIHKMLVKDYLNERINVL